MKSKNLRRKKTNKVRHYNKSRKRTYRRKKTNRRTNRTKRRTNRTKLRTNRKKRRINRKKGGSAGGEAAGGLPFEMDVPTAFDTEPLGGDVPAATLEQKREDMRQDLEDDMSTAQLIQEVKELMTERSEQPARDLRSLERSELIDIIVKKKTTPMTFEVEPKPHEPNTAPPSFMFEPTSPPPGRRAVPDYEIDLKDPKSYKSTLYVGKDETPPDVMIGSGDGTVRIQDGIGYYYVNGTNDGSTGDSRVKIYGLHEYGEPWETRAKANGMFGKYEKTVTLDKGRIIYVEKIFETQPRGALSGDHFIKEEQKAHEKAATGADLDTSIPYRDPENASSKAEWERRTTAGSKRQPKYLTDPHTPPCILQFLRAFV